MPFRTSVAIKSLLVMLVVVTQFVLYQQDAQAAVIVVNTTADDIAVNGNCTLREALFSAQTNSTTDQCAAGSIGVDTIQVPSGTYVLSIPEPLVGVDDDLNRAGDLDFRFNNVIINGGASTIIDGNGTGRVFDISLSSDVEIRDVTIRNGSINQGGGIRVNPSGTLTLRNSTVIGNHASQVGGGIFNHDNGTVTVVDSAITGNTATNVAAGIQNRGTFTIENSTINLNTVLDGSGSAIRNNSELTMENSTVSSNSGGGVLNGDDGIMTINQSTISGNTLIGGITNINVLSITNSTISGNQSNDTGGGITNRVGSTLNLVNVTISNNAAGRGEESSFGAAVPLTSKTPLSPGTLAVVALLMMIVQEPSTLRGIT